MAQILRYPTASIGKNDDFFQVNVIEYKPPGISGQGGALKFALGTTEQALQGSIQSPKSTILLPMPQSISDSNSCNWGESTLNAALAAGIQGGQTVIEGDDPFSGSMKAGSAIFKEFQGAFTTGIGQKAGSTVFSKLAVQALAGQDTTVTGLISRETGAVVNQNVEMLFQGVTIRSALKV